ncbi:hypothetical protein HMPREF3213_03035 [Heyndrickxia coagulans]|uniref:Uncharacterized protein n=1 Tax=Heyndrickxia coagulans TaxID=1398 RepID=A0A133KFU3_HEYCO|nr:hypothetical protein HMPREF3213_03035 [Heyndrickxia coagulans]
MGNRIVSLSVLAVEAGRTMFFRKSVCVKYFTRRIRRVKKMGRHSII